MAKNHIVKLNPATLLRWLPSISDIQVIGLRQLRRSQSDCDLDLDPAIQPQQRGHCLADLPLDPDASSAHGHGGRQYLRSMIKLMTSRPLIQTVCDLLD